LEREIHISRTFKEAEEWDILQNVRMTHEERQAAAAELKKRAYGENCPDVREAQRPR